MFNVGNNLLAPPLPGLTAGALPGSTTPATYGFGSSAVSADGINPSPQPPADASSAASWFGAGNGAGGYISQFMSTIFAALTQMAQYFTSNLGQPPYGSSSTPSPTPGEPSPVLGQSASASSASPTASTTSSASPSAGSVTVGGQSDSNGKPMIHHFFTSAELSDTGDPHDSFEGTAGDGETFGAHWSNQHDHPNLVLSNSFVGGFRISTDETARNGNGIAKNSSATIESDYGKNVVTMNADGSYSVSEAGKAVNLAVGQTQDLGGGESVTLNANGSLTVDEQNKKGGEITTTLTAKNGGVGISMSAQNVELSGYLIHAGERQEQTNQGGGAQPGATPQQSSAATSSVPANALAEAGNGEFGLPGTTLQTPQYQPYQPYAAQQPFAQVGSANDGLASLEQSVGV